MDLMPFSMCCSNQFWSRTVPSSKKGQAYEVTFDRMPPTAPYEYGFFCTCAAFKFGGGKECKHIKAVKDQRCGWHGQFDSGEAKDGKCPKCGGPVVGVMCAV
jgi:hypothetical protein